MTWLSRMHLKSRSLQRLADHNHVHRAQQGRRRRRMPNLDTLEARTLLSNVTAVVVAHELVITGDTHNDEFSVTENNATGQITVVGLPASNPTNPHLPPLNTTQINGLPVGVPYTTSQAVQSIDMYLPGDFVNTDSVTMTSTGLGRGTLASVTIDAPGVAVPGVEGLDLNLNVNNLTVSGEFELFDAPTFSTQVVDSVGAFPTPPLPPSTSTSPQLANAPSASYYATVGQLPPTLLSPLRFSNNLGGVLVADVTHSSLGSLYIEQDGCCQATVTVDHDSISGSLTVEEGVGAAPQGLHDTINVTNSTAGATFLEQGYGPTMPGCDGDGNVIYVQDDPDAVAVPATTGLFSLTIDQQGTGAAGSPGQTILVGNVSPVEVALTGPGIFAEQNDGAGSGTGKGSSPNVIHIESITVYGHLTNSFGPLGPPSIVTSQGDGSGDSTTIDSSTVWGNISASQGNGDGDTAYLAADTAGYTTPGVGGVLIPHYGLVTVSQGDGDGCIIFFTSFGSEYEALNVFNNLVTTQGDGAGDNTTIDSTDVVTGNIIVFQGNGAGDCVYILASTAGYTTPDGPLVTDHGGLLAVCQGNGYEDCIIINSTGFEYPTLGDFGSVFNNVLLVQGDGLNGLPVDCLEPTGPIIIIDETIIWSELWIFQNAVLRLDGGLTASNVASLNMDDAPPVTTDGPGLGNNVVDIGTGVLFGVPYDPPLPIPGIGPVLFENPGVVFVDTTYIYQGGANNTVVMGGSGGGAGGPDFETGTLDIWTGDGGGGTVYAINTTVEFGSYFGWNYVISGGGTGNTFIDAGNNFENGNNTLTTGPGY